MRETTTFEFQGTTYEARVQAASAKMTKARAYVWLGRFSLASDLLERASGERYGAERRKAERALLTAACAAFTDAEEFSKMRWTYSRKAGCACGCSPGFVSKDAVFEMFVSPVTKEA